MSYYKHQVFFCVNQREAGAACCAVKNAQMLREYAKKRIKASGLAGAGKIRINQAGCMGRCKEGPVLVIYPEAVWYAYQNEKDIDEIFEQHLMKGQCVQRLLLADKLRKGAKLIAPLDVESININIPAKDIVQFIHESRKL